MFRMIYVSLFLLMNLLSVYMFFLSALIDLRRCFFFILYTLQLLLFLQENHFFLELFSSRHGCFSCLCNSYGSQPLIFQQFADFSQKKTIFPDEI